MAILRYLRKFIQLICLFVAFFIALPAARLFCQDKTRKLKTSASLTSWFSKKGLNAMNIRLSAIKSRPEAQFRNNCLIISNHLSYLDILIISSLVPSVFVASKEVEQMPFLGLLAKLGGAVFIERRKASFIKEEVRNIADLLRNGFNVVVFPEGTTSNGETVLPFRTPFLESAKLAGKDVMPACLIYKEIDGNPIDANNRDRIFWYGDMRFCPHFLEVLSAKSISAAARFMECTSIEGFDRKVISRAFHCLITDEYLFHLSNGELPL